VEIVLKLAKATTWIAKGRNPFCGLSLGIEFDFLFTNPFQLRP
jgi:hypothetical protein